MFFYIFFSFFGAIIYFCPCSFEWLETRVYIDELQSFFFFFRAVWLHLTHVNTFHAQRLPYIQTSYPQLFDRPLYIYHQKRNRVHTKCDFFHPIFFLRFRDVLFFWVEPSLYKIVCCSFIGNVRNIYPNKNWCFFVSLGVPQEKRSWKGSCTNSFILAQAVEAAKKGIKLQ